MFDKLESEVRVFIIDVCEVMHRHGHRLVSVGALMRLFGIDDDRAQEFDDEWIELDEDFTEAVKIYRETYQEDPVPQGSTIH